MPFHDYDVPASFNGDPLAALLAEAAVNRAMEPWGFDPHETVTVVPAPPPAPVYAIRWLDPRDLSKGSVSVADLEPDARGPGEAEEVLRVWRKLNPHRIGWVIDAASGGARILAP
jgi:hypothetical protein